MSAWLQKTAVLPQAGESLLLRCPFWSIGCEGLCWTAEQENILKPNCHKQDWCLQPRCLTLSSQAREGSFGFMELNWGFHGFVFPQCFLYLLLIIITGCSVIGGTYGRLHYELEGYVTGCHLARSNSFFLMGIQGRKKILDGVKIKMKTPKFIS